MQTNKTEAKQITWKKMILNDLKAQGFSTIAAKIKSITSDHNSVNVRSENLFKAERETLEGILREYQSGRFDGMTDSYVYDDTHSKPRTCRFVFLRNEFSEDIKAKIAGELLIDNGVSDDASSMAKLGIWYDVAIWRRLSDLEAA